MYWFNREDLLYYHPNTGGYCYCELLIEPSDLLLQGRIPIVPPGTDMLVEAYEPDGLTLIENVTAYFIGIFAEDTNGEGYFNIRCVTFPPSLCDRCFVLRVVATTPVGSASTTVFDQYTQQYCIDDCCVGIGRLEVGEGAEKQVLTAYRASTRTDKCGNPILRISSFFTCIDNYTGEYWGLARRIIEGINNPSQDDINFGKVTNIRGLFKRLPREVKTTIALNCKTQKTEGTRLFMVQGSDFVPTWKMDEIEGQLSSYQVRINDIEVKIQTSTPFQKIQPYQKTEAQEYFRLDTTVQQCRIWQIFGCASVCPTTGQAKYATLKQGQSLYKVFDANGTPVATSLEDFKTYLLSQDGVSTVTDVSYVYGAYGYDTVLLVEGDGYIPSSFYLNYVGADAAWLLVNEVIDLFNACPSAAIGSISDESDTCPSAVIGNITDEANSTITDTVYSTNVWAVQGGAIASLYNNTVRLDFVSRATSFANSQDILSGEIVGFVINQFIPAVERIITENLPTDVTVIVGTDGFIRWFGPMTTGISYGEVTFTNVIYNI